MSDPTNNCPDPGAVDFLQCIAVWDIMATQAPFVPYDVIVRAVDLNGNVDTAWLAILTRRYLVGRRKSNPTANKIGE